MIKESDVYKIGSITRTHGVKGEVSLSFTDDVWDRADADYLVLRIDGILVPFFMEEYRFRSDTTALLRNFAVAMCTSLTLLHRHRRKRMNIRGATLRVSVS